MGPVAPDRNALVTLLARHAGSKARFRIAGGKGLAKGHQTFAINGRLRSGKWTMRVRYADPGVLTAGTSATRRVHVYG